MPNVSVYKTDGKEAGKIELKDEVFGVEINKSAMHDAVVAHLAARRQGTQSALTRSEVRGGGIKPFRQKGTGRARQGTIRAPQMTHGGVVFAPKPRDYSMKLNKKVRALAMCSALSQKVQDESLIVMEDLKMTAPKTKEMAAILNNLQEGDVLFVDEIHRLNRQVEEVLYPAMEDFAIDIMLGKDSTARSIRLDLPHFTLVGATTRAGLLTAPLRDRFGVIQRLEFYTPEELKIIILHSARVLGVEIEAGGAMELARRSRGTPRLANRLLKRVRDFAQVKYDGVITREVTDFALDIMDVDKLGLDQNDRNILLMIIEKFSGGPVGLDTLAAALGEDSGTLEEVYEPYLLMNGLINRTPRGRMATETAYRHLGLEMQKPPC